MKMSKSFNDKGWKIYDNDAILEIKNDQYSNFFVYEKFTRTFRTNNDIFCDISKPKNFFLEDIFRVFDAEIYHIESIKIEEEDIIDFTNVDIKYEEIVLHISGNSREIVSNQFKNIVIIGYSIEENFECLVKNILSNGNFKNLCFKKCLINEKTKNLIRTFRKDKVNIFADDCLIYRSKEDEELYFNKIKTYQTKMLRNYGKNFEDFMEDVEYFSNKINCLPLIRDFEDVYDCQFENIFRYSPKFGNEYFV